MSSFQVPKEDWRYNVLLMLGLGGLVGSVAAGVVAMLMAINSVPEAQAAWVVIQGFYERR